MGKLHQCQNLKNILHFRYWFSSNFTLFISILVGWASKSLHLVYLIVQLMYEHSEYFLPMCMCIHMCGGKHTSACVHVCYVHLETKGCLRVSLSVVLRGICWVKAPPPSEFTKLIYFLTSPGDLSLFPECWDFSQASTPTVHVEAGDLNAGPHVMDQTLYP